MSQQWSCDVCTFKQSSDVEQCSICQNVNPFKIQSQTNSIPPENKNEFPYKLGPFNVVTSNLLRKHFASICSDTNAPGSYQIDQRQLKFDTTTDFNILLEFLDYVNKSEDMNVDEYGVFGTMSPLYIVTLSTEAKKAANIPSNAKYFSWSYPSILDYSSLATLQINKITSKWLNDANITLLIVGGYMYFNENKQLLQINTLIPAIDGGLQFSKPKTWNNKYTAELHKNGRFQPITIASLSSKGAKYFCWLFPKEKGWTEHGGFVYLFHEPGELTDKQLVKMDRYFQVLSGKQILKPRKSTPKTNENTAEKIESRKRRLDTNCDHKIVTPPAKKRRIHFEIKSKAVNEEKKQNTIEDDYSGVKVAFFSTLSSSEYEITEIKNISNKDKIKVYESILDAKCKAANLKPSQMEQFLWHGIRGTNSNDILEKILKNGFDRSYNRVGRYGKGNYFATNSKYSVKNNFCGKDINNVYFILFCRVFIGHCTKGKEDMKTIPTKANGEEYDSLVDNVENPRIFVSWRDWYSIPYYLIKFKKK